MSQIPQGHFLSPWTNRHPGVAHFAPMFAHSHLPEHLAKVSRVFAVLAEDLLALLPDGPELAVALRKLLESKDASVRQAVITNDGGSS